MWYSPKDFADKGYEIPASLEDLKALSDKIVADGATPWCIGAESGVATGWVLTDWMEDFMLRTNGEDVYDQWVNHEIPFNDPKVKDVVDAVGAYVKNADYLGGEGLVKAIATTKFQDGGLPLVAHDGSCYMHRQASFYASLFPDGTKIGPDGDVNFFYLPSPADGPKYMLGAGDLYAAGSDKPETFDVLKYTGSVEYQTVIANKRGELSPNKNLDVATHHRPARGPALRAAGRVRCVPFRRLRHDARRRWLGYLLDRSDGMGGRWQHRRLREQRRGQLAEELSNQHLTR